MKRLKAVVSSLRERKRYIAFQVMSEKPLDPHTVKSSLISNVRQFIGDYGMGEAGVQFLDEHYSSTLQTGVIRVNHTYLDKVRASFCTLATVHSVPVVVKSVKVSGMIANMKSKRAS